MGHQASGHLACPAGTASSGKAVGTGSPGIGSSGSTAGIGSPGYDSGHWVTRHQVIWLASGHTRHLARQWAPSHQVRQRALSQLARQRAPDQVPDQQRASSQLA
ncbi:unnamed protein product [Staurois parvus]|uniref:Uncharacterized protein n=1 Tax=Staurois parvus TaxID=386267 RepID=A0ABN9BGF7_9NEOB|nr:unnamed protein product [Staurois parvus]